MSSQKIQQPQLQGLVTYERIQQQQLQGLVAYERIQQQQLQGLVAYERINPRKDYPFLSRTEGKRRDAMSLFICLIRKKKFYPFLERILVPESGSPRTTQPTAKAIV